MLKTTCRSVELCECGFVGLQFNLPRELLNRILSVFFLVFPPLLQKQPLGDDCEDGHDYDAN